MCVICWSQTKVAIHHHIDIINSGGNSVDKYSYVYQYRDKRTEPDWSDLSKFVLLCGSCHSKIHSTINFSGVINDKRPPILYLLNKIIEDNKSESKQMKINEDWDYELIRYHVCLNNAFDNPNLMELCNLTLL